ncbi:MAG: hypothetical protein O7G13_03165 [Alphaproteobacteria bacterium]|nr:hypothetical protein [Alphaproteobacteria bacterium]MCZ6838256.1 hypothetical protein [Alphaproteobacteria bacterium]
MIVGERTHTLNYVHVPAYVEVTRKMASPIYQAADGRPIQTLQISYLAPTAFSPIK